MAIAAITSCTNTSDPRLVITAVTIRRTNGNSFNVETTAAIETNVEIRSLKVSCLSSSTGY
ncbi:hypothetical protein [Sinorhizobium numidicum]|uniref:hypothetical protein n=1 Tax=Sinorhizobium numidicum TaxID=680248 RepID=UPI003CC843D6